MGRGSGRGRGKGRRGKALSSRKHTSVRLNQLATFKAEQPEPTRMSNIESTTKLHLACRAGDLEEVKRLGVKDLNSVDAANETPFMEAINANQAQVASYLLKQDGVKLPDEVWKFCRGKGMAEVLRQERLSNIHTIVPMDECWSDSDAPDDIDDEDSVIFDDRDSAMIETRSHSASAAAKSVPRPAACSNSEDPPPRAKRPVVKRATFKDVVDGIAEELKTETMKALYEHDQYLLIGLRNFLTMLNSKTISNNFLPFLTFIDAAQKQYALSKKGTPDPPHHQCSIFMGVVCKLYGNKVRDMFVGNDSMFHFPDCRTMNKDLREETQVEDQTPTGVLMGSLDLAFDTFGPDCPVIITMDERTCKPLGGKEGKPYYPDTEIEEQAKIFEAFHVDLDAEIRRVAHDADLESIKPFYISLSKKLPEYNNRVRDFINQDKKYSLALKNKIKKATECPVTAADPNKNNVGKFRHLLERVTRRTFAVEGVLARLAGLMNSLRSRCVTTPATYLAIPDEADYNAPDDEVHIRDIKQRTPTWFKARDDGSFSSSQFSPGFGYHTVKRAEAVQQEAWAKNKVVVKNGKKARKRRRNSEALSEELEDVEVDFNSIDPDSLPGMANKKLQAILRQLSLPVSGVKRVLVDRIQEYLDSLQPEILEQDLDNNHPTVDLGEDNTTAPLVAAQPVHSQQALDNMRYGTESEPHAVSTLVNNVLPLCPQFSGLIYAEEGLAQYRKNPQEPFLSSSGDGSLVKMSSEGFGKRDIDFVVEIKAPVTKLLPTHPKPEYLPQMFTQAQCYRQFNQGRTLPEIVHVVYSPSFTRVWTYKVEEELMDEFINLAHELYFEPDLSSRIKQGTKMPLHVRDFKLRLQQESKKFTLIGDFPSLLSSNVLPLPQPCGRRQLSTVCGEEDVHAEVSNRVLIESLHGAMEDVYNDATPKATQVMIFCLSDLTRKPNKLKTPYFMICWLPTAANITVETQRQLLSNLADLVEDRGFNVKAQCFDAKTRDLVVRGAAGEPLSVFQLQKDIWAKAGELGGSRGPIRQKIVDEMTDIIALDPGYELTDEDMDACVASGLSSEKATNGQWRISVDPGVKDGQTNITQLKVHWSHCVYTKEYQKWISDHPYKDSDVVKGWFKTLVSKPGTLSSGKSVMREVDYTHVGSRMKRMVMQGKIPDCNPDGWRKVASDINPLTGKYSTTLTMNICEAKGSDQMSMSMIKTFFSDKVANKLQELDFPKEATFCHAMADWLSAHDDRGIRADKRMSMMLPLFDMLMAKAPPTFPPIKGKTEEGLNFNLLEDIVVGIQARLFLYLDCKDTGYSARAFSSIDVENCHSILNYLEHRRSQTSTIEEMTRQISNLLRLQHLSAKTELLGGKLYQPSSTIYNSPEIGEGLAEALTSGYFDSSIPSQRQKEVRPFDRHLAPRQFKSVRNLGGHKANETWMFG